MAIIPGSAKVLNQYNNVNTTYGGSAAMKSQSKWYTMDDVADTINYIPTEDLPLNEAVLLSSVGDYQKTYAIRWTPAINNQQPFVVLQVNPVEGAMPMATIDITYSSEAGGQSFSEAIKLSFSSAEDALTLWSNFYAQPTPPLTTSYGINPVNQIGIGLTGIVDVGQVLSAVITITGKEGSFIGIVSTTD